ncbi:hypothetical protein GF386_04755 [Candidatus Pacearchaeota archaeon]|nr:hypothetical protein [Candidatus Pacearchaeota archaeon]MBD3283427.1 hypothetical protein [Candidatus Pacearchaeota archaeon]
MSFESLRRNVAHMKEIIREIYIFTNHLDIIKNLETNKNALIDVKEKKLLSDSIKSLTSQLQILNNSTPQLTKNIGFYQALHAEPQEPKTKKQDIVNVKYKSEQEKDVSLAISKKDKKHFLENLSKSHLSIKKLKKKYSVERPVRGFGKPNAYAKISNRLFRKISTRLISTGYFKDLNSNLRKMNSPFVLSTYISMILFTMSLMFIFSFLILILLMFFSIGLEFPFLGPIPEDQTLFLRFIKFFWIILAIPIGTGILMYYYPSSESKNIGYKINQELPFVAIHMSAIASSGVEPTNIFRIIIRSPEYKYTNQEFRKLMNLINFHGQDLVSALKKTAKSSPSMKLKELLDGLATSVTSGASIHQFLNKHAETLLFDYKLEREKYTKTSETFMDIYISIVIAAPMILLMMFVIMGSTGTLSNWLGLTPGTVSVLIILGIILLNIGFLIFLRMKQPSL